MQQASLSQLNDIVEPNAASWWPPAWPVVAIAAALILLLVVALVWLWRRYRHRKPQRIALQQLQNNAQLSASDITLLCKRVALAYYPREHIAQLSGEAWLRFLGADAESRFSPLLANADALLYKPIDEESRQRYQALAVAWIKRAKPRSGGVHV